MIIEPDFPDHWKTQMLIALTKDEAAPMLVIRLWGHCQQRKRWIFDDMTANALAAICRWKGMPEDLSKCLHESGFVKTVSGKFIVHEWEVVNHQLVTNWDNGRFGSLGKQHGSKGGRPTKNNPHRTPIGGFTKPPSNPHPPENVTPYEPPIEKRREEKIEKKEYSEEFEEFWKIYPKRIGKGASWKVWKKLDPSLDLQKKILDALPVQAAHKDWVKEEGKFIPHPATWLNAARWEDEIAVKTGDKSW